MCVEDSLSSTFHRVASVKMDVPRHAEILVRRFIRTSMGWFSVKVPVGETTVDVDSPRAIFRGASQRLYRKEEKDCIRQRERLHKQYIENEAKRLAKKGVTSVVEKYFADAPGRTTRDTRKQRSKLWRHVGGLLGNKRSSRYCWFAARLCLWRLCAKRKQESGMTKRGFRSLKKALRTLHMIRRRHAASIIQRAYRCHVCRTAYGHVLQGIYVHNFFNCRRSE